MNPYALLLGLAVHVYCLRPRRLAYGFISPLQWKLRVLCSLPTLLLECRIPD